MPGPPVGRHLPPAGSELGGGANGSEEHLLGRDAQHQTQRPVPVIEVEPVVRRPQNEGGSGLHRLVACAADLEENAVLPLQKDFAVVQTPGQKHVAKGVEKRVRAQPRKLDGSVRGHSTSSVARKPPEDLGSKVVGYGRALRLSTIPTYFTFLFTLALGKFA